MKQKASLPKRPPREYIAYRFAAYLREKPFRVLLTRGDSMTWHPATPVVGWSSRVSAYRFRADDWTASCTKTQRFVDDLKKLKREIDAGCTSTKVIEDEAQRIFSEIKKWGNPSRGQYLPGPDVLRRLKRLWAGRGIVDVDSTLTKLYAFARPDAYVIYDSRVAAAIVTIAEDIWRNKSVKGRYLNTIGRFRRVYPNLGLYDGTGGTRQRGYRTSSEWPNAYASVAAQTEANELCTSIRDSLNSLREDKRRNWTLREVEAVLFMEGY